MDWKVEVVVVPVSDVDRAKEFYAGRLGFALDTDFAPNEHFRVVQVTPPGSACSIAIGAGLTEMTPGSVKGLQMVVADIQEARAELVRRGAEVSEIEVHPWGSFVFFSDPDGNTWALQLLPDRG